VLCQQYDSKQQQYLAKNHETEVLRLDLQHQKNLAEIARQRYEAEITDWKGQFAAAKKEIAMLGRELDQTRSDLSGYILLYNRKEEYIIQLEQRNRELDQALRYRNSLRGLLRGLAGWMLRKMKAVAKRILRR
jgi:hypothetical protein